MSLGTKINIDSRLIELGALNSPDKEQDTTQQVESKNPETESCKADKATETSTSVFNKEENSSASNSSNNNECYSQIKKIMDDRHLNLDDIKRITGLNISDIDELMRSPNLSSQVFLKLDKYITKCNELLYEISKLGKLSDFINCDNVYSLSYSLCEKLVNEIYYFKNDSKNNNVEELKTQFRKMCYCEQLGIDENFAKSFNDEHFLQGAEAALKECGGDKDKAKKLALDYMTALDFRWDCIEDFQKHNSTNKDKDNFRTRTKKLGLLKGDKDSDLVEATKKFLKQLQSRIQELVAKKIKKNPDNQPKEYYIDWGDKLYKQTIGKLFINTDVKDHKLLIKVIKEVKDDTKAAWITGISNKLENADSETKTAAENELASQYDEILEGVSVEYSREVTKAVLGTVEGNEEAEQKVVGSINKRLENTNIDEINAIKSKPESERTPEEQKKLDDYNKSQNANIGAHEQACVSGNNKTLTKILKEGARKLQQNNPNVYRDSILRLDNHIGTLNLSEADLDKFRKILDYISSGNFSLVSANPKAELKPITDNKQTIQADDGIGVRQQEGIDINASKAAIEQVKQVIEEQTKYSETEDEFVVEPKAQTEVKTVESADASATQTASEMSAKEIVTNLLQNAASISVEDVKSFSLGLTPLIKQFSELKLSVQNHIRACLESQSEDDQVRNIDKMDKNSDKVDLALQLNISNDKLELLHLDVSSKKCLELREDVA